MNIRKIENAVPEIDFKTAFGKYVTDISQNEFSALQSL